MTDGTIRVLLVEDNPGDARLLEEFLSEAPRASFAITRASTLSEATAKVEGHHAVLLDLSLPDAQGPATIIRMKAAAADAPIIVLTGTADDDIAIESMSLGAHDYLFKSEITGSLVTRAILYALERRRSLESARRLLALEADRAASARTAQRSRFLADLSAGYAARLGFDEVVAAIEQMLVPELADACLLRLPAATEPMEACVARADHPPSSLRPAAQPGASRLEAAFAVAMRERRVIELEGLDLALEPAGVSGRRAAVVEGGGPARAVVLPLVARDRVVGALALVVARRPLDRDFHEMAAEVAWRTAMALDNALLLRAAQRALRARDEMLAVVSHDLRNPLSVVSLMIHSLKTALEAEQTPKLSMLARGARAVQRMDRLLADLLDVSRIDAGTLVVTKAPVDIASVVREIVDQNLELALSRGVALEADLPAQVTVDADRDRIAQVVANLLSNAIKFTPSGGRVDVSCTVGGEGVRVVVSDTGPGIAPDNLAHVFDRFYQADARKGGIGLGLAIVKGIVDAHGGQLGVESELGRGARFWFDLAPAAARVEASSLVVA